MMKAKGKEKRDEIREELINEPNTWFEVSYRIRYNVVDDDFDFEDIKQVRSPNNPSQEVK